MTSILTDEVYESMDPISQMLEPFESKLFDLIRSLPETLIIKDDVIVKVFLEQCISQQTYLCVYDFLNEQTGTAIYNHPLSEGLFKSILIPKVEGKFEFCDIEKKPIGDLPKIYFIKDKVKSTENNVIRSIIQVVKNDSNRPYKDVFTSEDLIRLKELAALLDIPPSETKHRSRRRWFKLIFDKLENNISTSAWRIRSESAIYKIFKIVETIYYGDKGWEAEKMSLIHLRLMVRSNKSIYKISEI